MRAALAAALLASAAAAARPPLPVAPSVDLARYMGTWYEIAHMPNAAQKGCTDTTVHYRLNASGGFDVANTCWKGDRYKPYFGKASPVDDASSAKFRVRFFVFFSGDYWITQLDPDYRWAAVGGPKRDQLWIISRERVLDAETYRRVLARARETGFDVERLERTRFTGKQSKGFSR